MKNRLKNINFYLTSLAPWSTIDSVSETGSFMVNDVTVNWYQLNSWWDQIFWTVIDANLEDNRELFRITNVNLWTKTLTFDKRSWPNWKKWHSPWALVQINDMAELFNHLSNLVDDFWLSELPVSGGLTVKVFWWEVRSNWISATIADATVTFTDNTAQLFLVFDYVTNTFKETTTLQSNHHLLYEVTTLWWEITSFVDKRWLSFWITTASAIPVFANAATRDAALPSPADWMQVCLVSEWVYTDYLNWAWISRWSNATPNATESVSGKWQITTQSDLDNGVAIWTSWWPNFVTSDKYQVWLTNKLASQAEAIAWTDNTKFMTPLRTKEYTDTIILSAFWDWSDWDVTITTAVSLSRDMYYNNLIVNSPWVLNPNWYKIYVRWTLSWDGIIRRNWNNWSAWTYWATWNVWWAWWAALNQWTLNADIWWASWWTKNSSWWDWIWWNWTSCNPSYTNINWVWWWTGSWYYGARAWWSWWTSVRWSLYNVYKPLSWILWLLNPASLAPTVQYLSASWSAWWWADGDTSSWAWWGWAWWNWWIIWIASKVFNFTWTMESKWWNWWLWGKNWWWYSMWWWGGGWQGWVIYLISSTFTSIGTQTVTWWTWWAWQTQWAYSSTAWTNWNSWVTIQITI